MKILKERLTIFEAECDCEPGQIRHNNGGNYHELDYLHIVKWEDDVVICVIQENTDTREDFPGERYEALAVNSETGYIQLISMLEDWGGLSEEEEKSLLRDEFGDPFIFREGEAKILWQNPHCPEWFEVEKVAQNG